MASRKSSLLLLILNWIVLPLAVTQAAGLLVEPPQPDSMTARERAITIATFERLIEGARPVAVGDREEELVARLGQPGGGIGVGARKRLNYDGGYAVIERGRIIQLVDIPDAQLRAPDPQAYADYQRAHGLVRYMGRWMTVAESRDAYARALADQNRSGERVSQGQLEIANRAREIKNQESAVVDIRGKGKRISKDDLVVPGKITVVDFYADWCGPCQQIAPILAQLAEHPDVEVRKVDIVNWRSPVAQQWRLTSIPNLRVYDRDGKPVGQPTHDPRQIVEHIQQVLDQGGPVKGTLAFNGR